MRLRELNLASHRDNRILDSLEWQNICYFCSMETLIVQPKTKEQLAAIKAFMKALKIDFKSEKPQTLVQYNKDLEKGDTEIEQGKFTTAADLKAEVSKW